MIDYKKKYLKYKKKYLIAKKKYIYGGSNTKDINSGYTNKIQGEEWGSNMVDSVSSKSVEISFIESGLDHMQRALDNAKNNKFNDVNNNIRIALRHFNKVINQDKSEPSSDDKSKAFERAVTAAKKGMKFALFIKDKLDNPDINKVLLDVILEQGVILKRVILEPEVILEQEVIPEQENMEHFREKLLQHIYNLYDKGNGLLNVEKAGGRGEETIKEQLMNVKKMMGEVFELDLYDALLKFGLHHALFDSEEVNKMKELIAKAEEKRGEVKEWEESVGLQQDAGFNAMEALKSLMEKIVLSEEEINKIKKTYSHDAAYVSIKINNKLKTAAKKNLTLATAVHYAEIKAMPDGPEKEAALAKANEAEANEAEANEMIDLLFAVWEAQVEFYNAREMFKHINEPFDKKLAKSWTKSEKEYTKMVENKDHGDMDYWRMMFFSYKTQREWCCTPEMKKLETLHLAGKVYREAAAKLINVEIKNLTDFLDNLN